MATSSISSSTPPPYYLRASVDNTPQPGQRVNVQLRGKHARTVHDCGFLRFRGKVHFAAGEWCGIELDRDQSWGRNDGSVEGVRYFVCEPRQGVFVRVQRCTAVKGDACCVTPPQLMDSSLRRSSAGMSIASPRSSASGVSPFDAILSFSPVSARSSTARSDADARFDALLAEYSSSGSLISNVDLEPWREKVSMGRASIPQGQVALNNLA
jgi:hypothetical protein